MFTLHVWVHILPVCSCGWAGKGARAMPRQAAATWVGATRHGGKVAAGVALRAEKCPGSKSVFLLCLLLVSLMSTIPPLAHASFSTTTLSFVLWVSTGLWPPTLCLLPNAPLLSCLSLLVLQQRGGTGAMLAGWEYAGVHLCTIRCI